nr:hypothetical protein [Tanacetum cinerariifolium]
MSRDDIVIHDMVPLMSLSCRMQISAITPPSWKGHLDKQLDLELFDLHDHAIGDPKVGWLPGEPFDFRVEDKAKVVLNVVPYVAMELVQSDDMGKLVSKIVSSSIFYERFQAFEEYANMKEPFDLTKVKGYRPSYKQEHTKAENEFATTTFLYLADVIADPYASVKAFLVKKPWILQRLVPTRTHVPTSPAPSQKAKTSSALASQLMSPPSQVTLAAALVTKPQPPPSAQ